MLKRLLGMVMCCVIGPIAVADVLTMNNGDRISGIVDSVSGGRLLLKTDYAGDLSVDLAAIASAESDKPLDLRLNSGDRVFGQLTTDGASQAIKTDDGVQPLTLTEVDWAVDDLMQGAEDITHVKNTAEVLGSVATGNSDTASWGIRFETDIARGKHRNLFSLALDQGDAEGIKTKDQFDFDYSYRWLFTDAWYVNGIGEYFFDKIKSVDERITIGAGAGYQFWDNSLGALSGELGGTHVFEEIDGVTDDSPAVRWALRWNRFFAAKKVELFHNHRILALVGNGNDVIFDATLGVRYRLGDRVITNFRIDYKHETVPAPGAKKTDVLYAFGMGLRL